VTEQPSLSFAGLLRQLRSEAKPTQEELARAAGLSPRVISDLERGINRRRGVVSEPDDDRRQGRPELAELYSDKLRI
jgi:transcriptional regulator with XRE-family HTH domain